MRKFTIAGLMAFLLATSADAQIVPPPPAPAVLVASVNLGPVNTNVASQTAYAVPAGKSGVYRVSLYLVETTADAASSTLPNGGVGWTDNDTGTPLLANTVTPTNTANAVGAFAQGSQVIAAKAGSNITYQTSNYASGTAGVMNYSIRVRVEFLQ